jgi:hypothetical protein
LQDRDKNWPESFSIFILAYRSRTHNILREHTLPKYVVIPDNVFRVRVGRHLKLKSSTVVVGAQGPEMGLLNNDRHVRKC